MNRGASLVVGTTCLCSLGAGGGGYGHVYHTGSWKRKQQLQKAVISAIPWWRQKHQGSQLPELQGTLLRRYVPSFRVHRKAHASCREAPQASSSKDDGLTARGSAYMKGMKGKPPEGCFKARKQARGSRWLFPGLRGPEVRVVFGHHLWRQPKWEHWWPPYESGDYFLKMSEICLLKLFTW